MAIEGALVGIHAGDDHQVVFTNYTDQDLDTIQDSTGWTIELDIRTRDRSETALLNVNGTISGVFNADPDTNTQVTTFSLSAALLATTIFKGDDTPLRYSVWRTDTGFRQPLRYGDVALIRTTQSAI